MTEDGAAAEVEVEERGLQAERTELAWIRTALACGALTTITGQLGSASVPGIVSAGLGGAVGAVGVAAAVLRIRTLRLPTPAPPPRGAVALLAASIVAADLVALALMFA
jgi:uncharacterized membrane protein YidH (DUF202 family)